MDWLNPETQEDMARGAYYQERAHDMALDEEHHTADAQYLCLSWESLSWEAQRPYRSAVAYCAEVFGKAIRDMAIGESG
jgi:hypothetical protein